jgi:hypothetical protein
MSKHQFSVFCFFLMLYLLIFCAINKAGARDADIPSALKPWKGWVLYGEEKKNCPTYYNNGEEYCCIWPSRLSLSLHATGGTFEQQWLVLAEGWVPLPGDRDTWPMDVRVNGEKAPVTERSGTPNISLKPGEYTVKGTYTWAQMPEMILIPPASGIIKLAIDGKMISTPLQEKDGRLWLKRTQVFQAVEDRMDVRVYRLITDNIPMEITTLLRVNVSGKAREESLKNVLPDGFLPMEITSPIPARIASSGNVTVQVRPGQWEIYIKGRSHAPVNILGPLKTPFGQEIWAFQPQNALRMVQIEGVSAVDPNQTDSPEEWRNYSTYVINSDSTITFKETSRGDSNPSPDQLNLERTWWLDFNGGGFTIRDQVNGAMSSQWYLAMNPPVNLGRVMLDGVDQLITGQGVDKKPGVELRRGQLGMIAESRIESSNGSYSAVGWDHDFQSLSGTLNLPPGWRLITVTGVDVVQGSWFQKWTLLDLFLVLIMSLAVFKLWGRIPGILTLVTLVLIYHEPGAPKFVWISLLASLALLHFIPQGWLRRLINLWRIGSILVLLVFAIPFIVQEIRRGVYPQLEPRYESYGTGAVMMAQKSVADSARESEVIEYADLKSAPPVEVNAPLQLEESRVSDYDSNKVIQVIDKDALNQTGPGIPDWNWRSFAMTWNGPVEKNQNIRFWLISPLVNLLLSFVRVILLCLLIMVLLVPQPWKLMGRRLSFVSLSALMLLIIPCASIAQTTDTGFPPDRLLEELKKRLLEKPDCLPYCADLPKMEITTTTDNLQILLQVDAAEDTVIPLPGSIDSWLPEQVLLESGPAKGIMRDENGTTLLLVTKGTQTVTLTGSISTVDDLDIPLPLSPRKVTCSGNGWDVQGVDREGKAESVVKLIRTQKPGAKKGAITEQTAIPSFFQVERILSLGLDWKIRTRVRRITPIGTTAILSIPLLTGESVTTSGIRVENGMAHIQMSMDSREVRWDSTLKKEASLALKASSFVSWTEVWALEASTIWHCDFSGIPVIHQQDDAGTYRPQWRPWPGEELTINITRPEAIQGQVVTIDRAELFYTPGERLTHAGLLLNIRTSKGGQHKIFLPNGAKLQRLIIQGSEQPLSAQGRELSLPLQPGKNSIEIEWNETSGSSILVRAPEIRIGEQAVNADITIQMQQNRWTLWTCGPRLGPAVLFWSYLVVIVLFALALGRVSWTPLKTRHWLLLGLGLSQVHPLIAIMVVGWLLAMGQRRERAMPNGIFIFDIMQVFLVAWTVAAMVGLYIAIQKGLLGIPLMQISGNNSTDFYLHWTQDRLGAIMPRPSVLSLHIMIFRLLMLAWALWLAYSLLKWLKWGWECFHQGDAWRKIRPVKKMDASVGDLKGASNSTPSDKEGAEKIS